MANYDVKLDGKNNQKKAICASTATITVADTGTIASGETVSVFNLPADAVVTNAYVVTRSAISGGTQTVKITVGGTDVIAAVVLGTAANAVKGGTVTKKATGTGAEVTATVGVADLTDGIIEVVVEYVEFDRTTGQYTK